MVANEQQWYQLSSEEAFKELNTDSNGLKSDEAGVRLERYGYNELEYKKPSVIMRFLRQFHNPLIYILLVAATTTGILTMRGEDMMADTAVILGVVILNGIIGFFQEGKTEAALEALRKMIVAECTVLRDGEQQVIASRELVPGDVVLLEGGDRIPADLRLFYTKDASADEAALTGESIPVEKHIEPVERPNLSPGDQTCIAFSGTFITRGSAKGVVVATGENTEFGKIARMVKETRKVVTPLQRKIAAFTNTLMIGIISLGALNFILGWWFGFTPVYSFLASVSLIVAAIPEMLPMIVTGILALAAAAMVKRNALIRRLPAAETLGTATVICSDKTGTLTKNEMTVLQIYAGGKSYEVSGVGYEPDGEFVSGTTLINPRKDDKVLAETLRAGYLCNNASLHKDDEGRYRIIGDPTEGALIVSATKADITDEPPRLDELPFESENMYMATLHQGKEENIIYVKGSPEKVLEMCRGQLTEQGEEPLQKDAILEKADEMAAEALRLLGMAYKTVPIKKTSLESDDIKELVFLGLQGMIDPPREEAIEAVSKFKKAGIRSVMITGDHVLTASAIARQLGILGEGQDGALTGEELAKMSDEDLREAVAKVSVYARVAPEHKLRIAQQLQATGQIVAMTGDGVNDAPALKAADIGIAMGITGTEVSKEASGMILTDDNFASIVGAVEEGRHAWNNLEKAVLYTLPTNGGQALLVMGAILVAPFVALFATRLPLEPIQILWVNLFDSVFLTMPLMMEPKDEGLLDVPPRDPKARIANRLFFERVGLVSVVMALTGFLIFWTFGHMALPEGFVEGMALTEAQELALTQAQTAALMSVVFVHVGYVMTARSTFKSAFTFSPFTNKWILGGVAATIIIDLMIVYVPFLNTAFRTAPFPASYWPLIIIGIPVGFLVPELEKLVRRQLQKRKQLQEG
ncbi:cation-translocating P-type ATPase [Chloroflexota bacterium]